MIPIKKLAVHTPATDFIPLCIRAYTVSGEGEARRSNPQRQLDQPSDYILIFDTETTVDAAQRLRFGVFEVRFKGRLHRHGMFYACDALSDDDMGVLRSFARRSALELLTVGEFVHEIFFPFGYDRQGTIVGFNLPFDISRCAIRHSSARGLRGGFSFVLSPSSRLPRVQAKHLSARASLIRFTHPGKQLTPRGERKKKLVVPPHRGFFLDVKTLAAALTSKSYSLSKLSEDLETQHRKAERDDHGGPLSDAYLEYAVQDVTVTRECHETLRVIYERHGLSQTPVHTIKSEAGLGKAYLKQMGIRPWRQVQPDFPPELLGIIMSTYYGGRSEVHIRRQKARVLYCDFLSMYPTVCTLMGLWSFVIAEGMRWRDSTEETRELLEAISLDDLQQPEFWPRLRTLVRIGAEEEIVPIRARYGSEAQATIGLNRLTSDPPLWYSLADCIASKLLTGKCPRILEAITFEPNDPQVGLCAVPLSGNPAYVVDPAENDLYRRVIDLRREVQDKQRAAKTARRYAEAAQFDTEQLALKILANATSYGIFVEMLVEALEAKAPIRCFGGQPTSLDTDSLKRETPGNYFHPLLATLITGAARLMLAITERLSIAAGLDWAFCDTDSMALAQPETMPDAEFLKLAHGVRGWFGSLNPYEVKGDLLKAEDPNFSVGGKTEVPLYCFAISAKRYVLFNLDEAGRPIIRKASAHGLGHLLAPYPSDEAPSAIPAPEDSLEEIGVERWQYDLWYQILVAGLGNRPEQPDLAYHLALKQPAISRYGATTPELLAWFKGYNGTRDYEDRVKPFGFLTALHAAKILPSMEGVDDPNGRRGRQKPPRPIATYTRDPSKAAPAAFDRETGISIPPEWLESYQNCLSQYHLHPEAKFQNGNFTDRGRTERRHIRATGLVFIGKEANRWEEQFFTGLNLDAVIEYGAYPEDEAGRRERVRERVTRFGQGVVARAAQMSLRDVGRAARDATEISAKHLARLDHVLAMMVAAEDRRL